MKHLVIYSAIALGLVAAASGEISLRQIELAERGPVGDAMQRVAAFQMKTFGGHAPTDWKTGTFFSGVVAAHEVTGDSNYLNYAMAWSESAKWKIPDHPLHADQLCTGQTYLDLFFGKHDPAMIADLKLQMEEMFNRTAIKNTELPHAIWKEPERPYTGRNLWWWCDALYMAPPVLARMSAATGDAKYRDLLHRLYWDSADFLYDKEDHLFYRDESQFKARTPNGKKVFWGRGNGWVYAGLIRTLDYLPKDDPMREKYIALFRNMTQSIVRYQRADGMWRSSLNDPAWFPSPETSSTSFFCYGLLSGINRGYLDRTSYLPVALRAWEGLLGCINLEGRLGYAQMVAGSPGVVRPTDFIDYTHGAFLLAGSELYKLNLTVPAAQTIATAPATTLLAKDAAWTWYNDERAIVANGYLLVGSLDARTGHAKVNVMNLDAVHSDTIWTETVLSSWASLDDHNNPAFLKLADGRILTTYSKHHADKFWNWRIATPEKRGPVTNFKWSEEQHFATGVGSTYANLVQLSAETNRIYNFFRAINFNPTFATSDDAAKTWSKPYLLIRVNGHRPYVKYADNGRDRIDFLFTDGHPRNQPTNNVYHMYYSQGNFYRTDGSLIRSIEDVKSGQPIVPAEATLVYAGCTAGRGWVSDLEYDQRGNPIAAYISSADGDTGNDLRYRHARWDANRKQWREQQIAFAGAHLYVPENHYSGGIALDPNDANIVYISTAVEPATGKPGATGHRQIYRGRTADGGETWNWEQLTFDVAMDNLRPFVPRQTTLKTCVLWFRGEYQTFGKYSTDIVGILGPNPKKGLPRSAANALSNSLPATFCRFVPERLDDFAWENDHIAFRAYGPAIRSAKGTEDSGIDCWLKRVKYPVIDKWYAGEKHGVSYHQDHGEGNDPYHVGSSRGCGGLGIWQDDKLITAGPYKEWKIISSVPDKSVFELTYNYELNGRKIRESKRITIELGSRLFLAESTFTENGQPASLDIAIGITTHDGLAKATFNAKQGWMACWEKIEGYGLGTGVVMSPNRVKSMREVKSPAPDTGHVLLLTHTDDSGKVAYAAGYAWEKAGEILNFTDWENYLANAAVKIRTNAQ